MDHEIRLFLDWKAAAYALRPRAPRTPSWRHDPEVATAIIGVLSEYLVQALPLAARWIVDAVAYGGFVGTAGEVTSEGVTLATSLAQRPWARRVSPHVELREFALVDHLLPSGGQRLIGLSRPDSAIEHAYLSAGEACVCTWRHQTATWLSQEPPRVCPQCLSQVAAELCQPKQKLVDPLLIAHALAFGQDLRGKPESLRTTEIWICSTDADFVPAMAVLAMWGIACVWLQPRANAKYGYPAQLGALGVRVLAMPQIGGSG